MTLKRLPVEIIWIDGFTAVTPGTQQPIDDYQQLAYGRNAKSRDDGIDDPDESIKTFQNPNADPKDKRPDKSVRLRGFASVDDRIVAALKKAKKSRKRV